MGDSAKRAARRLRYAPPALLTAGNAAAGATAAWLLLECLTGRRVGLTDRLDGVLLGLGIALMLDAVDGTAARALGASSKLGRKADAAADAVSFAAAPALLIGVVGVESRAAAWVVAAVSVCAAVYAGSAWLRLWRFQCGDHTAEDGEFSGLPTPAAALMVGSTVALFIRDLEPGRGVSTAGVATAGFVAFVAAVLMLCPCPYPHPARWLASHRPGLHWTLPPAAAWLTWAAWQPVVATAGLVGVYGLAGPMRWLLTRLSSDTLRSLGHGPA